MAVIDGIGMIAGLAPYVIPPGYKPGLIEFRGTMKEDARVISDEVLDEWDFEIRELFFEIDRLLFTSPRMCNTDGDPIEFHKLVYDIDSAETAFEKLASLCITRKADELREEAERDDHGHILRAQITWERKGHKTVSGLSNTILGQIVIDGARLTAEVNSARRARTFRGKIEARLGTGARFRVEEIGNLEKMMADQKPEGRAIGRSAEHDALMQSPEVRQYMADMMRKHWEEWVDMEIPALGGKTPRKAVLTSDGAEAVEALLAHAERSGEDDPDMREMNREGARLVRELLGLRKPSPVDE